MNLVDPKWARRASLTAEVVMVPRLRPETSMVSWEAEEPARVSGGGGGGAAYAACQGAFTTGVWGWCAHGAG